MFSTALRPGGAADNRGHVLGVLGLLVDSCSRPAVKANKGVIRPFRVFFNVVAVQLGEEHHRFAAFQARRIRLILHPRGVASKLRKPRRQEWVCRMSY